MDISSKIDELMEKKQHLIDIFPKRVPEKADNRYFAAERFFQRNRCGYDRKIISIILKLFCYYDMTVVTEDVTVELPETEQLISMLERCFSGDIGYVDIILTGSDALLCINSDDMYVSAYNMNGETEELAAQLVRAEGLFFYEAAE